MSEGSEWGPLSGSPVQGWAFCVPGALLGLTGGMTGVPCVYGASENKGAEKPHGRHPGCDKWGIGEDSLPEHRLRKRTATTIKCPRGAGWIKGLAEISITNARAQGVCRGLSGSELRRGCSHHRQDTSGCRQGLCRRAGNGPIPGLPAGVVDFSPGLATL